MSKHLSCTYTAQVHRSEHGIVALVPNFAFASEIATRIRCARRRPAMAFALAVVLLNLLTLLHAPWEGAICACVRVAHPNIKDTLRLACLESNCRYTQGDED